MATIMIALTIFNLSRLLSPQAAGYPFRITREATFLLGFLDVFLPQFMFAVRGHFSPTATPLLPGKGVISRLNYNGRALVDKIEQLDYVRVPHPDATAAVRCANLVLVFGAMNIDEAIARIGILLVQSVEP